VETFTEGTGFEVQRQAPRATTRRPGAIETTLYRLIQEALTNVVKHAHATTVSILLLRRDGRVTGIVEDDGRGFDPEEARADGLGLVGMRERAALVGGRLAIEAAAGSGTTIAVEVPVT
jgi:signal transduction histidine kinase